MNLVEDPDYGLCGEIINFVNFVDTASKKKLKLDSNRQVDYLRKYLVAYNGDNPDYEYIDSLQIDSGAGGGGLSAYGDRLLENWTDANGKKHRGLIDKDNEIYAGYSKLYPDAIDKLRLINPRALRTQMVEEFIELFELGVIRLPNEYSGQDFLRIPKGVNKDGEDEYEIYYLNNDEKVALNQIDLMKYEIASIHKFKNPEGTSIRYSLPKDKEAKMHDDRFYVMILLAHRLYELRRSSSMKSRPKNKDISNLIQIRPPKLK